MSTKDGAMDEMKLTSRRFVVWIGCLDVCIPRRHHFVPLLDSLFGECCIELVERIPLFSSHVDSFLHLFQEAVT